jgi:CO/xanthine dehydrogenase FAD-binding subunit
MGTWQHYVRPTSLDEALRALQDAGGLARPIAGGTDLLLDLRQGRHPSVDTLVDVTGVAEMTRIERDDGRLWIGAAVPLALLLKDQLLPGEATCLWEACQLIGGPQVRNVATLGGNVAHGLPAADGAIALLAMQAEAELYGPQGRRSLPISDLFAGPGEVTFDRGQELLVGFSIQAQQEGDVSAFRRVMRPQGVAIAILNFGAWVRWDGARTVRDVRLALGPSGRTPFRARGAEAVLRGSTGDRDALDCAREALLDEVRVRTSPHRATADYRRHLAGVLLNRTWAALVARRWGETAFGDGE